MRLYQRQDGGVWYYDFTDAAGQRRRGSTGLTNKREAKRAAESMALQAAQAAAERPAVPAGEITLRDCLTAYVGRVRADRLASVTTYERLAAKTLGDGEGFIGRHRLDGDRLISGLTGADIEALKAARAAEGNAPGTIGAEAKLLRAACRFAVDRLGKRGPSIIRWSVPTADVRLRYLSQDEWQCLYDYLSPRRPYQHGTGVLIVPGGETYRARQDVQDLALCLVLTGCRWGEVSALTWPQVEGSIARIYGQKTKSMRLVPLAEKLTAMMSRRRAKQGGNAVLVFPNEDGERRAGSSRALLRAFDRCGLNDPAVVQQFGRATIHTLRHTYASWLRGAGVALEDIQPLLGHASIAQTQRYAKISDSARLNRAASVLNGL